MKDTLSDVWVIQSIRRLSLLEQFIFCDKGQAILRNKITGRKLKIRFWILEHDQMKHPFWILEHDQMEHQMEHIKNTIKYELERKLQKEKIAPKLLLKPLVGKEIEVQCAQMSSSCGNTSSEREKA